MKTIVSVVFLLISVLTVLRPLIPIVRYYTNIEVYKARCVNIQRPSLECNGQCALKESLKESLGVHTDSAVPFQTKISSEDFGISFLMEITNVNPCSYEAMTTMNAHVPSLHTVIFYNDIFHPPSMS
jgi:hypothetical protein